MHSGVSSAGKIIINFKKQYRKSTMKPFEKLFTVLMAVYPLSDALKEFLAQRVKIHKFKTGHILLEPGEVANHIYFITKGLLRAYYTDDEGEEQTFWLMMENDMMASAYSFFTRRPGELTIEVIEECELISIDYETLEEVYKEFIEFNIVGRILTQKYYTLSDERAMILRMKKIEDRYWYMQDNHPALLNRVKQKDIASYLGTTSPTIWRVKKMKRKKLN
jgi:CRP-like cAMP-binding protein